MIMRQTTQKASNGKSEAHTGFFKSPKLTLSVFSYWLNETVRTGDQ